MEACYILLLIFVSVVKADNSSCGPDGKCFCDSNKMDCSNTKLPVSDICELLKDRMSYNVSILRLERNNYQRIEEHDFQGCYGLDELYLGRNNISYIHNSSFSNFQRLNSLDLNDNNMNTFYKGTIQQNQIFPLTIKSLMLNGNLNVETIGEITYPDVSYLRNLNVLYMDGILKEFPVSFREIETLHFVSLSGFTGTCNISQVTNSTFENLLFVRHLNLSACNIENIYAGAFENLLNMTILDLSHNLRLGFRMLRNISYSLQFTPIESLNYSKVHNTFGIGTQIMLRDLCYLWNTTVTEIVFNSNRLQLVETNSLILLPTTLKVLRVEDNEFTVAPYLLQLACMANLEEYYGSYQFSFHNLSLFKSEPYDSNENIANDDFRCPFLQNNFLKNRSLTIENCPFFESNRLPQTFPTFPRNVRIFEQAHCYLEFKFPEVTILPVAGSLEYLDISNNIFYSIEGPVGAFFPTVKHVNISRNYCSHIGVGFFKSIKTVENLQLQENFLGLMLSNEGNKSNAFDELVNVRTLNLSFNVISYLPPTLFSKMLKLETLDLSSNNIETMTIDTSALENLLHLNLKANSIHTLPVALTDKLELNSKRLNKKFTIDLRNNTFKVGCDVQDYLRWMIQHKDNMLHFNEYIFRNKHDALISTDGFIEAVNNFEKECKSYTAIIVFSSIFISVFLAVVLGGFIYKNRWKLRYLMRRTKIRHFGYARLHDALNEPNYFDYDAFISYANENFRFILDQIIPKLENEEMKLCVHDRDFLPGNNIADNILDAIRNSRKTVVILTKEFLKSKWCLYEFNMARMESIYSREGANCLLVVMFGEVPTRLMSNEMLEWIKSNTYIEYTAEPEGELLFWQNLKEALSE